MKKPKNNILIVGAVVIALLSTLTFGFRAAATGQQVAPPHNLQACSAPQPPCYAPIRK